MNRSHIKVFKALSDPNRMRIMKMVLERELCLCEVREILDLSNSTVSKHLTILRDAGLVLDSKEGKWVNFRINDASSDPIIRAALKLVRESFGDDDHVREDLRKVRTVNREKICGL